MKLFVDVGNSFLKWRVDSGELKQEAYRDGLERALERIKLSVPELDSVFVSSVKSQKFNDELSSAIINLWSLQPCLAKSQRQQAGVTCVYKDPTRLGVDRWLAMIAAFQRNKSAVCVIDCGTATTVDVIGPQGSHVGGFIIPGANLMERGLLADTDKIIFTEEERQSRSLDWGENTAEAVINGIYFSQIAIIEKCIARCKQQFAMIQTILTGGYGAQICNDLTDEVIYVPDLVLDGLRIYSENMDFT